MACPGGCLCDDCCASARKTARIFWRLQQLDDHTDTHDAGWVELLDGGYVHKTLIDAEARAA